MRFRVMHTFSGFCMSFAPVSSDSSDANLDCMAKWLLILEVKRNFVPTAKSLMRTGPSSVLCILASLSSAFSSFSFYPFFAFVSSFFTM